MSELCEHETFKDVCGICHRDGVITRLRADNERLRAALASIDELFSQAAQDDCENGVRWLNERAAERYLARYPHTSAAISYAHKVARAALAQGGDK